MNLRAGEWVEVRSEAEILATLDERGCLEDLPFMPQMARYCGRRFQVSKRAHKLCDTVNGTGARRMKDAVFLAELRCDGQAYGGCEMECLIFWKEAWLERVGAPEVRGDAGDRSNEQSSEAADRLEQLVARSARPPEKQNPSQAPIYRCQATQMPIATERLSQWDPRQYLDDLRSGNAGFGEIAAGLFFLIYETVASSGLGLGSFLKWSYDQVQRVRGGTPYPSRAGRLPKNSRTPSARLDLCPGELVKVRTHSDVLGTVNEALVNRGLGFHPEMVQYCSRTFRVSKRLRFLMNEKTGQVRELKNECLVLEGAPCVGRYTNPIMCPRGMYPYWRENWLERTEPAGCSAPEPEPELQSI